MAESIKKSNRQQRYSSMRFNSKQTCRKYYPSLADLKANHFELLQTSFSRQLSMSHAIWCQTLSTKLSTAATQLTSILRTSCWSSATDGHFTGPVYLFWTNHEWSFLPQIHHNWYRRSLMHLHFFIKFGAGHGHYSKLIILRFRLLCIMLRTILLYSIPSPFVLPSSRDRIREGFREVQCSFLQTCGGPSQRRFIWSFPLICHLPVTQNSVFHV